MAQKNSKYCKNCINHHDCWIKAVLDLRTPAPTSGHQLDIVLAASRGDCPLYEGVQ